MTNNDIKPQTMKTIPILGLLKLFDSVVLLSTRIVKQGELDPCHKGAATIAVLVKAIKEAEVHNKNLRPDADNAADLDPDNAAPEQITREPLSPEELRTRLTRYLKRLDDEVVSGANGNVYESSKKH